MLKAARENLTALLERSDIIEIIQKRPDEILSAMEVWYTAFKDWEKDDKDFAAIWRDHRMLMRSIGDSDSVYQSLQAKAPSYADWKAKGWVAAKGDAVATKEFKDVKYNTGREGILKRTVPDNVSGTTASGQKKKYAEGLMDVSGTLLRKDKAITEQLHNKPKRNDWACFMPLSDEPDQELLLFLKDKLAQLQIVLGKGDPLNRVINKYKTITARVTHITLAFETDMALGFVAIPNPDDTYSKFKYMVKSNVKYSMNNADLTLRNKQVGISDALAKLLRNNVKRYKSVVGIAVKNEVRIAFREHKNPMWPLFARWIGDANSDDGYWEVWAKSGPSGDWTAQAGRIANRLT